MAMPPKNKRTIGDSAKQLFGQIPAGAIQSTIANALTDEEIATKKKYAKDNPYEALFKSSIVELPSAIGNVIGASDFEPYNPALIENIVALPALAREGYNYLTGTKREPTGDRLDRSLNRLAASNERVNEFIGINDPENTSEMVANIAGGLILPLPAKAGVVNSATKFGRVGQTMLRGAVELGLPLRQTSIGYALPLEATFGLAAAETFDALDPQGFGDYEGIADAWGFDPSAFTTKELSDDQKKDNLRAHILRGGDIESFKKLVEEYKVALNYSPEELYAQRDSALVRGQWKANPALPIPHEPQIILTDEGREANWQQRLAAAGATLAGAFVATRVAQRGIRNMVSLPPPPGPKPLAGQTVVPNSMTAGQELATGIVQQDEPIRVVANELFAPDKAKQVGYRLDVLIPQAIGTKIEDATVTGNLPGSAIKMNIPVADFLESYSRELSPQQKSTLNSALLAASALDDRRRAGKGIRPSFSNQTDADLQQAVAAAKSDPLLNKYFVETQTQHRKLLQYANEQGLISNKDYADMRTNAPNYVPFNRNLERLGEVEKELSGGYTGENAVDSLFQRALGDRQGVQQGAVREPMTDIANRYASIIRTAELNKTKLTLFNEFVGAGAGQRMITDSTGKNIPTLKELPDKPDNMDRIHVAYDNGRPRYFLVGDPALDTALKFLPRETAKFMGSMRQFAQSTVTGVLDPQFAMTVSPVYDTFTSMLIKPKGYDLGILNESINRLGGNLGEFSRLDPTQLITAPIGALRYIGDSMVGALASNLTKGLFADQESGLVKVLGRQRATAVQDWAQRAYDSSIKSFLMRSGASSHLYADDAVRGLPIGLHDNAPNYYNEITSIAHQAALDGRTNDLKYIFENASNKAGVAASKLGLTKANVVARMYTGLIRAMQEGTRYQFVATNAPKLKSLAQLDELASHTRRIAIDAGQYGGNPMWNRIADSTMYANITAQSLAGVGRAAKQDPINFALNLGTVATAAIALRYGAMLDDPEVAKNNLERTDPQKASSFTTFGGVDVPIEPMQRLVMAPTFAILDQIAFQRDDKGSLVLDVNGSPQFDPNFGQYIAQLFDDEAPFELQERVGQAGTAAASSSLDATIPGAAGIVEGDLGKSLSSIASGVPLVNYAMAGAGIDPGLTRITGEAVPVQEQKGSPLGGDGRMAGSIMSANTENMVRTIVGNSVFSLITAADEAQRALYAPRKDGSKETSTMDAIRVGVSRFTDEQGRRKTPAASIIFGNNETVKPYNDTQAELLRKKLEGMDAVIQSFNKDVRQGGVMSNAPSNKASRPLPTDTEQPDYSNTQLAQIGSIAYNLNSELSGLDKQLSAIKISVQELKTGNKNLQTPVQERNKKINELNDGRRHLEMIKLGYINDAEENLRQLLGDKSFTFNEINLQKYAQIPILAAPSAQ